MRDGRRATHYRDSHRDDFNDPFSEAELREKFRELASTALSEGGVTAVERAVDRCDDWPNVDELTGCLGQYGRAE